MDIAARVFPSAASYLLSLVPGGVIFAIFVFATAVFTGTTFAWMANKTQSLGAKAFGWAIAAVSSVFWIYAAATVEEWLLVCLPPGIGLGILFSCCLGHKVNGSEGAEELVCDV
jgi:hypothetical protein